MFTGSFSLCSWDSCPNWLWPCSPGWPPASTQIYACPKFMETGKGMAKVIWLQFMCLAFRHVLIFLLMKRVSLVLCTVNILPCVPWGPRPRGTRWPAGVLNTLALVRAGSELAREDFIYCAGRGGEGGDLEPKDKNLEGTKELASSESSSHPSFHWFPAPPGAGPGVVT